jgi:hypothetical protein
MELPTEGLGPRSDDSVFQPQLGKSPDDRVGRRAGEDDRVGRTAGETAPGTEPGAAAGLQLPGEPDGPRPATGEPRVDAALARLDELAGHPVTEHRAIFEDVHQRLRDVLGELDTRDHPDQGAARSTGHVEQREPSAPGDAGGAGRRSGR